MKLAKKPLTTPSKEEVKKSLNKEISVNLKLKDINDTINHTKKEGTKEIRKVSLINEQEGVSISLKGKKVNHPLRGWDKRMFESNDDILMTLSVPNVNQKKITDYAPVDNEEDLEE